ncbi:MAG: PD-(D/E)XK nuclease superfamily protein [Hyphomicrobiales bacterium]
MLFIALISISCAIATGVHADADAGASLSGRSLENEVAGIFLEAGIPVAPADDAAEPYVRRNVPYRSIYGHEARIEFMLAIGGRRYLVETKRMASPGSVDEKLPYVWLNALANRTGYDFILVMDGDGWKSEARAWIERKARTDDHFTVLGLEGFKIWLALQLRQTPPASPAPLGSSPF